MKRLILLAIPLFMVLAFLQNSYAKSPYRSYEVSQIRSDGIVVRDFDGKQFLIEKAPGDIQVGDIIRYDSVRKRLRKSPWQAARVIRMTGSAVTLQIGSGEKINVNMRSRYTNEFKEGEQVLYDAATGQVKKNNFQQLGAE